jgi:hypothetical protein
MRLVRSTDLDCPPAEAIQHARTPRLLEYVAAPWVRFEPVDPPQLPDEWAPGGRYRVRMRLLGVLPLGVQTIAIRAVEQRGERLLIHDQGSGDLVRVWDHRIELSPAGDGTRYCDRVTVEAGWRTPFVGVFARLLFAHRQRRWQRLVRTKFDYGA